MPAGYLERYSGTEYSMTDMVDKSKFDIVVVRCDEGEWGWHGLLTLSK